MTQHMLGRFALITGGTNGIGAGTALRLLREGASVAIVGRNEEAALRLIQEAKAQDRMIFIKSNIADPDEINAVIPSVLDHFPHIDVLVNSAGGSRLMSFLDTDPLVIDEMLSINLRATFLVAKATARSMIECERGGSIINISSISGQRGSTMRAAYGMAKSAVIQLTKVMAVELAEHAIRVNAIAPGPIETRAVTERHLPTTRRAYMKTIPMKRYGTVEEVAAAAAFLASDEASYVTGHVLNVDGGFNAAGILEQASDEGALSQ